MPSSLLNVVPHGNYYLHYNGFTFDPATTETKSIQSRPIPTADGRTIKNIETVLAVKSHIFLPPSGGVTIDATMEALKQKLMSQAGALYYRDKGFGDFQVNVPGGAKKDANWGPIPEEFRAVPIGDAYAWEIHWSVRVTIPWCPNARFEGAIAEWVYKVGYALDNGGYLTRTVNGHIEIPLTRATQADRLVRETADDYRDKIKPDLPRFFTSEGSHFDLSEDRKKLTFQFTHKQMTGDIPPPGVLSCSMSQSMANEEPFGFAKWTWTLSATYEMVRGVSQTVAGAHFYQCWVAKQAEIIDKIKERNGFDAAVKENNGAGAVPGALARGVAAGVVGGVGANVAGLGGAAAGILGGFGGLGGLLGSIVAKPSIQGAGPSFAKGVLAGGIGGVGNPGGFAGLAAAAIQAAANGKRDATAGQGDQIPIVPMFFRAEDPDRFDKPKASFTMVSVIFGTQYCFLMDGLWTPFRNEKPDPSIKWNEWHKKAGDVFGVYGTSMTKYDPTDDVIIDVCRQTEPVKMRSLKTPALLEIKLPIINRTLTYKVDAANSWLDWSNDLQYLQDDDVTTNKPLPEDRTLAAQVGGGGLQVLGGADATSFLAPSDRLQGGFQPANRDIAQPLTTITRRTASTYMVVMTGHAIRVGFPPNPPSLLSIGGQPVASANDSRRGDGFKVTVLANLGAPLYGAAWQLRYLCPASPTVL